MNKRIIIFLIGISYICGFHFAFAGLDINEIMYDLPGSDSTNGKSREWIEVYNPDSVEVAVDASKWRIYDGSANRTINGEVNFSIPAGSFAIFSGDKDTFLVDHPGFSGVVYDTGIASLNNTGATLKILDQDLNSVDSVTYASAQGGAGDGNSLQKISGSFSGANPTPGTANGSASSSSSTANSGTGGLVNGNINNNNSPAQTTTATAVATKNKIVEEPKIKTQIIARAVAFAGIPSVLEANATGVAGERLLSGKYFWNFGDGDSSEVKLSESNKFTHTYFYEGEYIVSVEYYMNYYRDVPDATDKMTIKVVPASILISRVGDEKDFFIELSNNTDYDTDLSNWILGSAVKSFVFPHNTIIGAKKKMIISSVVTNFSILDKNTLKLFTPGHAVVSDYMSSVTPAAAAIADDTKVEPKQRNAISLAAKPAISQIKDENKVASAAPAQNSFNNLSVSDISPPNIEAGSGSRDLLSYSGPASLVESDVVNNGSKNSYVPMLISIIFIGTSAGAVYYIRRKKTVSMVGDDFDIFDA